MRAWQGLSALIPIIPFSLSSHPPRLGCSLFNSHCQLELVWRRELTATLLMGEMGEQFPALGLGQSFQVQLLLTVLALATVGRRPQEGYSPTATSDTAWHASCVQPV